eukprot:PhM_4_TR9122/c0_g1_i1/m.87073
MLLSDDPVVEGVIEALTSNLTVTSSNADAPTGSYTIGTHAKRFTCGEALATGLLAMNVITEKRDHHVTVVRHREADVLNATCDALVGTGGRLEAHRGRFDTKAVKPEEPLTMKTDIDSYKTRLSPAGAAYQVVGKSLISKYYAGVVEEGVTPTKADLDLMYDMLYTLFVEHIDAYDNDIPTHTGSATTNYRVSTSLPERVERLYPDWNNPKRNDVDYVTQMFRRAVLLTTAEFYQAVDNVVRSWLPARHHVRSALQKVKDTHSSGRVLHVESPLWRDHLHDLEEELGIPGQVHFVVYQDPHRDRETWRVHAVPMEMESPISPQRTALPWLGLEGEDLHSASGVGQSLYVHPSGTHGAASDYHSALKMALLALGVE